MYSFTVSCTCAVAQFSKALSSSNCEDWNLDLSGRFSDGMIQQQSKVVHVSTQTSVVDTETPAVHVWPAVDRATSTEGHLPRDLSENFR